MYKPQPNEPTTDETDRRYRVGILGSYGGMNLGDEAILQSILIQLRRSLPLEVTAFTRNPEDTQRRHQVERAIQMGDLTREELLREIQPLDLLILGGGGILFDSWVTKYLKVAVVAEDQGIPVMGYAVGSGPLTDPAARDAVRTCFSRAAAVTVRERSAQQALEELGVDREIRVTADPALLLEPEPLPDGALEREDLDRDCPIVGLSVREPGPAAPDISEEHYHALLANAADFMVERFDADIVFVPMEPNVKDSKHSHAVISQMTHAKRASVLKGDYTSGQVLTLVRQFNFAVGMRLHFLIFAALQGVPFVALPYATKVSGLLQELQIDMPPLKDVNAGRMLAYVDRAWDLRNQQRERIQQVLPDLQGRARENNRLAVELLRREKTPEPSAGEGI